MTDKNTDNDVEIFLKRFPRKLLLDSPTKNGPIAHVVLCLERIEDLLSSILAELKKDTKL